MTSSPAQLMKEEREREREREKSVILQSIPDTNETEVNTNIGGVLWLKFQERDIEVERQ